MPRVASLFLPHLPIDRIRRHDRARNGGPPDPALSRGPADARSSLSRSDGNLVVLTPAEEGIGPSDCSCPRGGGWRPGSRWSQADIDALPVHQRPPMRDLGRRTEPAKVVFSGQKPSLSRSAGSPPPAFRGEELEPLLTSHKVGSRVEIAAACPAARALGLTPGMALTYARSLVPGLDVRDADHAGDAAFLTRFALFAAQRWTPRACVSGTDGLFLDLTGVVQLFGGERRMCEHILRFCARLGYQARIAVAGTAGAAHALARHARQPITLCPVGGEAEAIAPLPVAALRLDEAALAPTRRLGIDTIGEFIAMPRAPLGRRFGSQALTRLDQALGRIGEPLKPVVPQEAPRATLRLLEPIATAETIAQVLTDLMPMLVERLEAGGLGLRLLQLACDRVDGEEQRIVIGTARATRDRAHLLRLMLMKIEAIEPGFGIEAMHLVALRTERLDAQAIDGEMAGEKPDPDISELVDKLAGRIGARRLYRVSAVESDVPERSTCRIHPLAQAEPWPSWPRPVRLLARPEPLDKVMALLPDGAPRRFAWRGRMHNVRRADGPERIHGEWWRRTSEAEGVRDYFQVEDDEGQRFWLFRKGDVLDPRTGDRSWWMQGLFG